MIVIGIMAYYGSPFDRTFSLVGVGNAVPYSGGLKYSLIYRSRFLLYDKFGAV